MSERGLSFAGVDGQAGGPERLEAALGLTVVESSYLGSQRRPEALTKDAGDLEQMKTYPIHSSKAISGDRFVRSIG
jgi:hypothetical protein